MNARRFEITAEEIGVVVARFYADIRHHPVLGPVFARHVTDWSEHESRIMSFWRNAILREQGYDGNPMFVHKRQETYAPRCFQYGWTSLIKCWLLTSQSIRPTIGQPSRTGLARASAMGLCRLAIPQTSAADREAAVSSAKSSTMPEPLSRALLNSKIPFPRSPGRGDSPLPA